MRYLSLPAALLLTASLGTAADAKKNRTAPLGYSDTPMIPGQKWKVHDIDRPRPRTVMPGTESSQARPGRPPSDAVVLFDGKDLSKWSANDGPAKWTVAKGEMWAETKVGSIFTKEKFGDIQLHLEFATPTEIDGTSQWRANSGVLIMNRYEFQVLDSWDNPTYADGQAGAIYGQWPPLVNASRKPGEWQSYDIVFEAPKFEGAKLVKPAYATVFFNGVLMHHKQEILGPMAHRVAKPYEAHGAEEPLGLQDHETRVKFRNIWVRRLTPYDQK
ncbi:MAG: DUF1080 domain-containing protein [Bryobacteraceae bacterium]